MLGLVLYPLLAATSLVLSAYAWEKLPATSARPNSAQRNAIFFGCVVGLAVGAKLGFFLAEGPWILTQPGLSSSQRLLQLMAGKTITGALIGAYAGVEYAKHRVSYREPTGDTFALIAPCSIALSRLGCLAQGCCLGTPMSNTFLALTDREGISRWPAVPFELAFNLAFLLFVIVIQQFRKHAAPGCLRGQLFHVYLLSYGLFRFGHEFLRETPRWHGAWSGYHALALSLTLLGAWGFPSVSVMGEPRGPWKSQ
jgi:phosphatidylglycerol---prolipoprotein diacylglyceryl transferase